MPNFMQQYLRVALAVILAGAGSGAACGDSGGESPTDGGQPGSDASTPLVGELASRTQGVAPLAVFFDAVDTPGVRQPLQDNGHREYADLHYAWDFGDPSAGNWTASGRSRNSATGYVAAHVYETPGTYTARLTVTDATGQSDTYEVEIVVEEPDVVYAEDATVCLSTGTDFAGCPAGATQVTTDQPADLEQHLGDNRRILLRRGDVWSTTGSVWVTSAGPLTLGAFGDCESPDARGLCANAPVLQVTDTIEESVLVLHQLTDARIMDLRLEAPLERHGAIGGVTGISSVLVLRVSTEGFDTPLGASHWDTDGHDQYMYVRCDASASGGNILYTGSERLALLGNRFANPGQSHVVRVWQSHKGVISHNDISGSSINSDAGRHALKFHGPGESVLADTGLGGLARRSRYTIVSNNLFGGSGPWPVGIGPQDSGTDERLEDIVVEQNRFYPGWGDPSCCSSAVQISLLIWARHATVRNNIFSGEGSSEYFTAVSVGPRGIEPAPVGVRILNNTVYKSDPMGAYTTATAFSIDAAATDTTVINNLIHFSDGFTEVTFIEGGGQHLVEQSNLVTDNPGLTDPDNGDFLSKDFSLTATSPALDTGVEVPVFDDFAGTLRPQGSAYDLGAYER